MNYIFIITGWNAEHFLGRCLASFCEQVVPQGCSSRAVACSDGSEDLTQPLLFQQRSERLKVLWWEENRGAAYARYRAMHAAGASEEDVFVLLDMDDYLANKDVLMRLEVEYASGAEATFGSWCFHEGMEPWPHGLYPPSEIAARTYRQGPFRCPPLRTFRAGLGLRVTEKELKDDSGEWLRSCTDVALSWSVLDRIRDPQQVRFINDVLYVYRGHHASASRKRYRREKKATLEMLRRRLPAAT